MNQNGYNSQEEQIIDVPYYTRGLSDGNNLRISRRIIRAQNVINYRRKISKDGALSIRSGNMHNL